MIASYKKYKHFAKRCSNNLEQLFFEKGAHNQIMPRVIQFVCNLQKYQTFCEVI